MKLRYFFDLHLEFIKPNKIEKFIKNISVINNDVCILAGDIGNSYQNNYDIFMKFISKNFKKSFVITGNHEYYNKKIEDTNIFLKNYFKQFSNISFLNNEIEYYNNYCFIGTTLLSNITNSKYKINDVYNIHNFINSLNGIEEYNKLNKQCIEFLEKSINSNDNCIVITHHILSSSFIDIKYKTIDMLPYNQWFYCDLDNLININKHKIKYCFYEHTYTPSNVKIHNIPFLCNSIGYPNENIKSNFDIYLDI
jgi:predicted phosphohydrolase